MNANISLENLLYPLLSLTASNKKWIADRLYESCADDAENPRKGWEDAAMEMRRNGDDELLVSDIFEDEKMEEIVW